MRIISGRFKKKKILTDSGKTTRPTTDFLREVIFSALFDCSDDDVLDLFAGSGAIGLEALSRGAKRITFVDAASRAVSILKKNIENTKSSEECRIYKKEVLRFIESCEQKFSLVFVDPPYNKKLINKTISLLLSKEILDENWRIVIEHSKDEVVDSAFERYIVFSKLVGNTHLTILQNITTNEEEE